jgi:hypothetical protein
MKRENWLDYGDLLDLGTNVASPANTLANLWGDVVITSQKLSAEKEIEELHKLFDELAPDTSEMKSIADKLRSILTEPRFESVRK